MTKTNNYLHTLCVVLLTVLASSCGNNTTKGVKAKYKSNDLILAQKYNAFPDKQQLFIHKDDLRVLDELAQNRKLFKNLFSDFEHLSFGLSQNHRVSIIEVQSDSIQNCLGVLTKFKYLKSITFKHTNITSIEKFSHLTHLKKCYIKACLRLNKTINMSKFNSLEELTIDDSGIEKVIFPKNTNLNYVSLVNNNVRELDTSSLNLTNLKILSLNSNKLEGFNLSNLKKLERVYLHNNPIKEKDYADIRSKHKTTKVFFECCPPR